MDAERFDALARTLLTASRRGAVRLLAGAILGGVLSVGPQPTNARKRRNGSNRSKREAEAEACIPTGKRCPAPKPRGRKGGGKKGKRPKQLSCQQCCQRRVTTNANGKKVCYCAPEGEACTETRECCDGTCTGGTCQLTAAPAPPQPAAGCTPTTCAAQGKNCGSLPDGCGGTLTCGSCSNPTPVCVTNICTACTASAQCPTGTICDAGSCQSCDVVCGPEEDAAACGARLQTMIADVTGPGTIRVCPGTYRAIFTISRDLTLIGAGEGEDPAANTILQGTGANPVGASTGGFEVTLQRLRITGGGGGFGGGIRNLGGSVTLITSTVSGNTAARGGGISNDSGGTLTLTNSTVSGNRATTSVGGGIYNSPGGTLILTNSDITGNEAPFDGGGIYNGTGTVSIDGDSQVTRNTATSSPGGDGGGIYNSSGMVTLANNQIVINNCPDNCAGTPVANCAAAPIFCPAP